MSYIGKGSNGAGSGEFQSAVGKFRRNGVVDVCHDKNQRTTERLSAGIAAFAEREPDAARDLIVSDPAHLVVSRIKRRPV